MHIGIIGGGMIGSTMARLWVDAGHHVCIASRHPEQLQPLADDLGPRASAGIPAEELIGIATRNGAAALNDAARYGTIEAGKQADLIVLTEDPRRAARAFRPHTTADRR